MQCSAVSTDRADSRYDTHTVSMDRADRTYETEYWYHTVSMDNYWLHGLLGHRLAWIEQTGISSSNTALHCTVFVWTRAGASSLGSRGVGGSGDGLPEERENVAVR